MKRAARFLLLAAAWVVWGTDRPSVSSPSPPDLIATNLAAEQMGVFCDLPARARPDGAWMPAEHETTSGANIQGQDGATTAGGSSPREMPAGDTPPVRYVLDPYPTFNGVAVDPKNDRVFFSDTNRKGLLSYPRTAGEPPDAVPQPLTHLVGPTTGIGYVAGVAVDPVRREVYTVNNDIEDRLVVFPYDAQGNVKPKRVLYVPHQAWGVSINHERDEIALSVQAPNLVVVYRREASGLEPPLRMIKGHKTGLADPHGIFFDARHNEIVVANHGNWRGEALITAYTAWDDPTGRKVPTGAERVDEVASGRFRPGSITVYPGTAQGDVAPIREIMGPLTQINWPMGIVVDPDRDEIVVASNGNDAVLVFPRTASGNVAPIRVLRGPRTGIRGPMGVAVDPVNDELWVANFNDHTALVFPRTASGNVAPKRILRNAPPGTPTSGFGNPYSVAYDTKRDEILVPN